MQEESVEHQAQSDAETQELQEWKDEQELLAESIHMLAETVSSDGRPHMLTVLVLAAGWQG
jgi:hypothetical protein